MSGATVIVAVGEGVDGGERLSEWLLLRCKRQTIRHEITTSNKQQATPTNDVNTK